MDEQSYQSALAKYETALKSYKEEEAQFEQAHSAYIRTLAHLQDALHARHKDGVTLGEALNIADNASQHLTEIREALQATKLDSHPDLRTIDEIVSVADDLVANSRKRMRTAVDFEFMDRRWQYLKSISGSPYFNVIYGDEVRSLSHKLRDTRRRLGDLEMNEEVLFIRFQDRSETLERQILSRIDPPLKPMRTPAGADKRLLAVAVAKIMLVEAQLGKWTHACLDGASNGELHDFRDRYAGVKPLLEEVSSFRSSLKDKDWQDLLLDWKTETQELEVLCLDRMEAQSRAADQALGMYSGVSDMDSPLAISVTKTSAVYKLRVLKKKHDFTLRMLAEARGPLSDR